MGFWLTHINVIQLHLFVCVCLCIRERESVCLCVGECVCLWEREKERESVCVCVCVRKRESVCVCQGDVYVVIRWYQIQAVGFFSILNLYREPKSIIILGLHGTHDPDSIFLRFIALEVQPLGCRASRWSWSRGRCRGWRRSSPSPPSPPCVSGWAGGSWRRRRTPARWRRWIWCTSASRCPGNWRSSPRKDGSCLEV